MLHVFNCPFSFPLTLIISGTFSRFHSHRFLQFQRRFPFAVISQHLPYTFKQRCGHKSVKKQFFTLSLSLRPVIQQDDYYINITVITL
jgi:hypothetical protein